MAMLKTIVAIAIVQATLAYAQNTPPSNASSWGGTPAAWAPYSNVTVVIDSSQYPPGSAQYNAVKQGYQNLQSGYSSQNITYSFQSFDGSNSCPVLGNNSVYVTTQTFTSPNQYGLNQASGYFSGPYGYYVITQAQTTLSPTILGNSESVTYGTAHEGSHDLFLGDCPSCPPTTLMTYNIDISAPPYLGPQSSDIGVVYSYGGGGGDDF